MSNKVAYHTSWSFKPASLEAYNASNSRLYRLPTELLLLIEECLPKSAQAAIRQTCRNFRSLFKPIKNLPEHLSWTEREIFISFVRFSKLLAEERSRKFTSLPSTLLCSFCKKAHSKDLFSTEQLLQMSELRRCLGAEARVKLCSHICFTRAEVEDRVQLSKYITCTDFNHRIHSDNGSFSSGFSARFRKIGRSVIVTALFLLLEVDRSDNGPSQGYRSILDRIAEQEAICAHIRFNNPRILRLLDTRGYTYTDSEPDLYSEYIDDLCCGRYGTGLSCVETYCLTHFHLLCVRASGNTREKIMLLSIRWMGAAATDPEWLSQLSPNPIPFGEANSHACKKIRRA